MTDRARSLSRASRSVTQPLDIDTSLPADYIHPEVADAHRGLLYALLRSPKPGVVTM